MGHLPAHCGHQWHFSFGSLKLIGKRQHRKKDLLEPKQLCMTVAALREQDKDTHPPTHPPGGASNSHFQVQWRSQEREPQTGQCVRFKRWTRESTLKME